MGMNLKQRALDALDALEDAFDATRTYALYAYDAVASGIKAGVVAMIQKHLWFRRGFIILWVTPGMTLEWGWRLLQSTWWDLRFGFWADLRDFYARNWPAPGQIELPLDETPDDGE